MNIDSFDTAGKDWLHWTKYTSTESCRTYIDAILVLKHMHSIFISHISTEL